MKNWKILGFRIFTILALAISLSMVFIPEVKSSIRSVFLPKQRLILATTHGVFDQSKGDFQFVKVKTREGVYVEVYHSGENQSVLSLVDRIELLNQKDAFFTFDGQMTNLAIDDIDGDKTPELMVPTLDQQMVAHLNVFRFSADANRFELVEPSQIK